jgi:hypothetical protein
MAAPTEAEVRNWLAFADATLIGPHDLTTHTSRVIALAESWLAQRDALQTIAVHGDETPCDAGCAASMKATARAAVAAVVSGTPE